MPNRILCWACGKRVAARAHEGHPVCRTCWGLFEFLAQPLGGPRTREPDGYQSDPYA